LYALILIMITLLMFVSFNIYFGEIIYCQPNDNIPYIDEYRSTRKPLIVNKGFTHEIDTSYIASPYERVSNYNRSLQIM